MARNIEFQGKDSYTGEWVVGNLLFANSTYHHHEVQYHDSVFVEVKTPSGMLVKHLVIPQTVGQYTNVIGCDNKRIYDHDIVSNGITEGEVYWDYCYNGWKVAVVNEVNDLYGIELDKSYKVISHKYDQLIHETKKGKGDF